MNGNNDESLMKHLLESNSIDLLDLDCTKPTRSNFPCFWGFKAKKDLNKSPNLAYILISRSE